MTSTATNDSGGFPLVADMILRLHEAESDGDEGRADELRGALVGLGQAQDAARAALTKESAT